MESFFCYNFKEENDEKIENVLEHMFALLNDEINVQECDDLFICCPTCNIVNDVNFCNGRRDCNKRYVYLEIEDYVGHPMLWCDACDGLIILLKDTVRVVSKEYIESKNSKYFSNQEYKEILNNPKNTFVSVRNAFIKKFTPTKLSTFVSKKQLSSDETSLFSKEWNKFKSDMEIKKKLNILEKQYETYDMYIQAETKYENDLIKTFLKNNEIAVKYGIVFSNSDDRDDVDVRTILNISVDVNSYDINKPVVPYVQSIDTNHDGCHIYVLCENEKGEEFASAVWGD